MQVIQHEYFFKLSWGVKTYLQAERPSARSDCKIFLFSIICGAFGHQLLCLMRCPNTIFFLFPGFPIIYGCRYDSTSHRLSVSSPALSPVLFKSRLHAFYILFSVVLSSFSRHIHSQHFPRYVLAISPHHMPVPVQSSSR